MRSTHYPSSNTDLALAVPVTDTKKMTTLLNVLLWCPGCWRGIGRLVFYISSALALLGLRAMSRFGRIEVKTGVVIDVGKVFDALPFPVPTSPGGFAMTLAVAFLGFMLARAGKWAERV